MTFTPHATVGSSTVTIPGKVGIGATSLTRELTVQENGQADISIVAATNQYGQLLFGDTDADNKGIVAYNNSTDVLEIWTSGSARMAVTSSGFVGINDTAPPRRLSITGEDGAYSGQTSGNSRTQLLLENNGSNYIEFLNAEANSAAIFWSNEAGQNEGAIEYKDSHMYLQANAQANQLVLNDTNGYVHLTGSNDVRLTLSTEGTAGDNSANWVRGNSAGLSFNAKTSGKFMWEINGDEKMRMDSTGNLAIGGSPVLLSSGYDGAQFHIRQSVSNGGAAIFLTEGNGGHTTSDGAIFSMWNDGHVYMQNQHNGAFRWYMDASLRYSWSKDYLYPELDDSLDLGLSNKRWDDIYASSGTVNSSDETLKRDINALSEAEKAVALKIKGLMRTFRWKSSYEKKGDDARYHTGVVAQQVEALFKEEGLDISKYAFWVKGVHYVDSEGKEIVDEYGAYITPNMPAFEKVTDKKEAYRYSIRYDQLLCFIIGAM
tara:strand:- start:644 stop:2107 length:1464 start_codon:yes stop_codon:yes gene_type:complete